MVLGFKLLRNDITHNDSWKCNYYIVMTQWEINIDISIWVLSSKVFKAIEKRDNSWDDLFWSNIEKIKCYVDLQGHVVVNITFIVFLDCRILTNLKALSPRLLCFGLVVLKKKAFNTLPAIFNLSLLFPISRGIWPFIFTHLKALPPRSFLSSWNYPIVSKNVNKYIKS